MAESSGYSTTNKDTETDSTYMGSTSQRSSTTDNTVVPGSIQVSGDIRGRLNPISSAMSDASYSSFARRFNISPTDMSLYRLTTQGTRMLNNQPLAQSVYVDTYQRQLNDQARWDEYIRQAQLQHQLHPPVRPDLGTQQRNEDPHDWEDENDLLNMADLRHAVDRQDQEINETTPFNFPPVAPLPMLPRRARPPPAALEDLEQEDEPYQGIRGNNGDDNINIDAQDNQALGQANDAHLQPHIDAANPDLDPRVQPDIQVQAMDLRQQAEAELGVPRARPANPAAPPIAPRVQAENTRQAHPVPLTRGPVETAYPRAPLPGFYIPPRTTHWVNSHYGHLAPRAPPMLMPPVASTRRLEIAQPIQQHIANLKATHEAKQTTYDAIMDTNQVLLNLLQYVGTGAGNPAQLARMTQQVINNINIKKMSDTTADKLANSERLMQALEERPEMPPISRYGTTDLELLKAKNVRAAVTTFDPDNDTRQSFSETWRELLRYTRGHALSEQNYTDILFYVLKGSPRKQLLDMTSKNPTSLQGILDHFYGLYCKPRTMEDLVAELRSFTRKPNEGIRECMARAKYQVSQLRPTTQLLHGSYVESENHILRSMLFSLITQPTKAYLDLKDRQRQKYGVSTSLDVLTELVADYEITHTQVPTSELVLTGLYLPSNLAHLATNATPTANLNQTVQSTTSSDVEATLRELTTFVAKLSKDSGVNKPKHRTDRLKNSTAIKDLAAEIHAVTDRTRSRSTSPSESPLALALSPSQSSTSSSQALPGNQMEWYQQKSSSSSRPSSSTRTDTRRSPSRREKSPLRSRSREESEERRRKSRDSSRDRHRDLSPSPVRESTPSTYKRDDSPSRYRTPTRTSSYERGRSSNRSDYKRSRSESSRRYRRESGSRVRPKSPEPYRPPRDSSVGYRSSERGSYNRRDQSPSYSQNRSYQKNDPPRKQWVGRVRKFNTPKTIIQIDDRPKYKCKHPECNVVHIHRDQIKTVTYNTLN